MTATTTTVCRWCGAPATHRRTVEPEQINAQTKKVTKAGLYADVCDQHNAMFDREERRVELRKKIARLESNERRGRPFNPETLATAKLELDQLSR